MIWSLKEVIARVRGSCVKEDCGDGWLVVKEQVKALNMLRETASPEGECGSTEWRCFLKNLANNPSS
jgi:hypothetical protein